MKDIQITDAQLLSPWKTTYSSTPYDVWTRTNVGEVFPSPVTPLTSSVALGMGEALFREQPQRLRLIPPELIHNGVPPAVFSVINGRVFYNTGLIQFIFTDVFGFPSWFWLASLGGPQNASGALAVDRPFRGKRVLRKLPAILRENGRQRRIINSFTGVQPRYRQAYERERRVDLNGYSDSELMQRLHRLLRMSQLPESQVLDGSAAALNAYGMLAGLSERWCGERTLANDLITGLSAYDTANATTALWAVARTALVTPVVAAVLRSAPAGEVETRLAALPEGAATLAALRAFFHDFGHRCVDEFELSVPRWSEAPGLVYAMLRAYLDAPESADPVAGLARQVQRREEAEQSAHARLGRGVLNKLLPYRRVAFDAILRQTRALMPLRENPKHHYLMFIAEQRRTILALADRLVARGHLDEQDDVFMLSLTELEALTGLSGSGLEARAAKPLVAARRALYERYLEWQAPEAISGEQVERVRLPVPQTDVSGASVAASPRGAPQDADAQPATVPGATNDKRADSLPQAVAPALSEDATHMLKGLAASGGKVTAKARVALTPEEGAEIEPGEVLVAPFTDPGWTPLFAIAGAVVMDLGGLLSHGAIVAREYGIPAVVNTRSATKDLVTGQMVTVDGVAGTVTW